MQDGSLLHSEHDAIVAAVRERDHESFQGMGYTAERRELGTFWDRDHIRTLGFDAARVPELLAEARSCYGGRPVWIHVSGREVDRRLGPALIAAGCKADASEFYLAHVGAAPAARPTGDATFEPVDESSLREACDTRLRAFANSEEPPDPADVQLQIEQRRPELASIGRGFLARVGEEPASVLFCYDDPDAKEVFVFLLGTRLPFRGRALAERLLAERVEQAYARGCRTTLISVLESNAPALSIYRRLGFTDVVNWRRGYLYTP